MKKMMIIEIVTKNNEMPKEQVNKIKDICNAFHCKITEEKRWGFANDYFSLSKKVK
jgi:hypothetical protein